MTIMTTIVRGIYRDGIIYPLDPVPLPDNTPVILEFDMIPVEITEHYNNAGFITVQSRCGIEVITTRLALTV